MNYGNYGTGVLDQLMARYGAGLHPAPATPASALNDLDNFIRALPPDERKALEADSRVEGAKNALIVAFMDYLIGATPFGQSFCAGVGMVQAQNLLDTVKSSHREIAGRVVSEQQAAQNRLAEQEAKLLEQERKIAELYKQLGVNDVATA